MTKMPFKKLRKNYRALTYFIILVLASYAIQVVLLLPSNSLSEFN